MLPQCKGKILKHILLPFSLCAILTGCQTIETKVESMVEPWQSEATSSSQSPQKIALVLPLSGSARALGKAFEQGFYNAKGNSAVSVTTFDSKKQSIAEIMEAIRSGNFDTVVGPLLKNNVEAWQNNSSSFDNMNVLLLNNTANDRNISRVCSYSLTPEQEAEQSAIKMKDAGIQNPMVLVPNNLFGKRVGQAFIKRWVALGGNELNLYTYQKMNDLRPIFVNALKLKDKKIKVDRSYDESFKPIDGVFGLGNTPQQIANIKTSIDNTLLKLPLYTTSRVNSPNNQYTYDLLMSGVQFTDIALFQNTHGEEFKAILKANHGDYSLMRVYAMGMDAWRIINSFNDFRQSSNHTQQGVTGKLISNDSCQIQLEMPWFEYGKKAN